MASANNLYERLRAGLLGYVLKFGVVGLLGFVVDVGVFNILRLGTFGSDGWWATALGAKVVSTSIAIIFNWLGNRFWTFRANRHTHILREFIEFIIASLAGMVVALACLWFTHHVLGLRDIVSDNISGNVVGLALGTLLRFVLYRYWVWNPNRAQAAPFLDDVADFHDIATGSIDLPVFARDAPHEPQSTSKKNEGSPS